MYVGVGLETDVLDARTRRRRFGRALTLHRTDSADAVSAGVRCRDFVEVEGQ